MKTVTKMTRDGAVEINKDSGEIKRISNRESELSLSGSDKTNITSAPDGKSLLQKQQKLYSHFKEQSQNPEDIPSPKSDEIIMKKSGSGRKSKLNQLSRFKRSKKRYRADRKSVKQAKKPDFNSPNPNHLDFTDEERSNPNLKKHIERSEQAVAKLETATAELPAKKKLRVERTLDENSGRGKTRLTFREEVKRPDTKLHHSPLNRPINEVAVFAHSKIHQVEKENVGVESAHSTEKLAEHVVSDSITKYRHHRMNQKLKPFRKVAKLEGKSDKANIQFRYEKAKSEHNLSSNPLSRMWQKHQIKVQYNAEKHGTKSVVDTVKKVATKAVDTTKKAVNFVAGHGKIILIVIAYGLVFILLLSGLSACMAMFTGGLSGILGSTYTAEDEDIHDTDLYFTELEVQLQEQITNIESDYPGYDEYVYILPQPLDFTHDPFRLIAFLSAIYEAFTYDEVQAVIDDIFNEMYSLGISETVETRYRTEYEWVYNPDTDEYELVATSVPYEYKILTVTLVTKEFDDIITPILEEAEATEIYELYMETGGNHQYFGNPFDFAWKANITSLYGYRIHPIDGVTELHRGLDIAAPNGTDIMAIHTGTVITATFHSSYGNYIVIETDRGYTSVYAHCSELLVSVGDNVTKHRQQLILKRKLTKHRC